MQDDQPTKQRRGISHARTIVRLVVFLAIVVGLIFGLGLGGYSSFGIDAIAYICPLGALETLIAGHTIIPRALISLICVLIIVALLGRVFCSWVCPVQPLSHFFHPGKKELAETSDTDESDAHDSSESDPSDKKLTDEENKNLKSSMHACTACAQGSSCALNNVGGKRDGFHFDSRYGVLLGALVASLIFGFPVFCLVCPIGLSFSFVVCIYRAIFEQDPTWSILIFAAILVLELVVFRKWCHKICPLGALMSLIGAKAPIARPRVNKNKCLRTQGIDCHTCVNICPELLDPHAKSIPECTRCGQCVEACPAHAISFRKTKSTASLKENTDLEQAITDQTVEGEK